MLIIWTRNAQVALANIVHSLIIYQKRAVGVLNSAVGGQDRIVWLNDRGRDAWGWVYSEFEFTLLAVVGGEALKQERTKAGASSTAEGVEDKEALERGAGI
jgi:hypothetical protein